jgi:hypothetical protein
LIATGRVPGDSRLLHLAILDRLAANRRIAVSLLQLFTNITQVAAP